MRGKKSCCVVLKRHANYRYLDTIEINMYYGMRKVRSERGFTLIELLVVIAIIGMLSSVILASLSSARERARDARRASDLRQVGIALEMYYDDHQQYPEDVSQERLSNLNDGSNSILPYIDPIPTDPIHTGQNGYRYRASNVNGRQSYSLLVKLDKNDGVWCSVSVLPGQTVWIEAWPACNF